MEPQLLESLSRVGYEPGVLARLAETTEFVELTCRLTLLCSTLGLTGSGLPGDGAMDTPWPSHRAVRLADIAGDEVELFKPALSNGEHPLAAAYRFATSRYAHIKLHLRDYECLVVKREKIDGELSPYQHLQVKVRSQRIRDGRVTTPFAVFAQWLSPKDFEGRRVLYVAGWNEGKMRVRKGGGRFSYIKLNLSPFSEGAMSESHHPITEVGMVRVAHRIINLILDDVRIDPHGVNTQATFFKNAKVSGRVCTRIEVVHPSPWPGMTFHKANLFIDDQLHVPIRIEIYEWPDDESGDPVLSEEYTYLRLRVNVGLTDADFSPLVLN